ncbi:MAG: ABC transporter permease [Wenzhouxiangellaceae bacterium]|nr:ABC transporter permease [Wenzhouxiangellaceae bacterium]
MAAQRRVSGKLARMVNRHHSQPEMRDSDARPEHSPFLTISGESARLAGEWTLAHAGALERRIAAAGELQALDASGITRLDASGALLLERLLSKQHIAVADSGLAHEWQKLYETVQRSCDESPAPEPFCPPAWERMFERIGRSVMEVADATRELLSFLGLTLHRLGRTIRHPKRLRLTATVHHMEQTGLDAAPLLVLLASLVGAVMAFLGATILSDFGAELFVVDLVAFAFVREFGVLLTAILLAGRTASAFCAQIGMMKSREEIDAIRTLGLDEIELLVLPRLIALIITLPLLTFIATLAGLLGGLVVAKMSLDVPFSMFVERVQQTLTLQHYLVGMIKAPIFAVVIALIGCLEGLRVSGTAQSVGEHTTIAVVRSLTMVIVLDAFAAVYFMEIGW